MIRAHGLAKRFSQRGSERVAIENISFEVRPGEIFGLLGPNGGGKTTTMRLLAGLLRPSAGAATIAGKDLSTDSDARRLLGFLTEQPGLYDRISARENLLFFARLYELPRTKARPAIDAVLERLSLLERARDKVGSFSKGMRQRLALGRALLHQPPALLLDEPTSGLDPEAAAEVRRIIHEEAARGAAIVISTHNLAEAERLCNRVAIVKNRLLSIVDEQNSAVVRAVIRVRACPEGVAERLITIDGLSAPMVTPTEIHFRASGPETVPEAVAVLVSMGARIEEVLRHRRALEERYLEAVGAATDAAGAIG